uniref:NIDO domain-containing protein n=1 Tax=Amphimedon queenslandica TaxID=400682 RepID=A0A1X7T7N5_AMPQE
VFDEGYLGIRSDGTDDIYLNVLYSTSGRRINTKAYGRTTTDPVLINRAVDQINEGFPNTFCSTSPPTQIIIATWIDFQKFDSNQGSNFQLIIVTNGNTTFGIALYVNVAIATASAGIGFQINNVYESADPSFFPFGATVMDAPSMMLNSNIPGTYIFPLYDIPPDPCSSVCYSCKPRLVQLACETMRINGEDVPASCNN